MWHVSSAEVVAPYAPHKAVFVLHQAQALARQGVDVTLIAAGVAPARLSRWRHRMDREEDLGGVRLLRAHARSLVPLRFRTDAVKERGMVREIGATLAALADREGRPDIIHAHSVFYAGVGVREFCMGRNVPIVLTEHSSAFALGRITPGQRVSAGRVMEAADAIVSVSRALGERLAAFGTTRRSAVVPNVLDPVFEKEAWRPLRDGPLRFVSVGSLDENKNHGALIRAFHSARLPEGTRLTIVGDGPLRHRLSKLVSSLNVGASVELRGALDRNALLAELRRSDAMVHASRYETFGVALIEGLALGLPVVAVRTDGTSDIVNPDCGMLIEDGEVASLRNALEVIASEARKFAPEVLHRSAVARFGGRKVSRMLLDVYRDVLASRAAP